MVFIYRHAYSIVSLPMHAAFWLASVQFINIIYLITGDASVSS